LKSPRRVTRSRRSWTPRVWCPNAWARCVARSS
jgi:hypothetical protein